MGARKYWRLAGLVLVIAGALIVVGLSREREATVAKRRSSMFRPRRIVLDPEKLRAHYRVAIARAKELAERTRSAAPERWRDGKTPEERLTHAKPLVEGMLVPCILGPADLCEALVDVTYACADGDARACIAAGQLLTETPPRPLVASAFFFYACKHGDAEGCARIEEIKHGTKPCEEDEFGCAHRAFRAGDQAGLETACSLGFAEACARVGYIVEETDPELARAYLEQGCQLGGTFLCKELGRRLSPGCEPEEDFPCYEPDPEQAAAAKLIACEVGLAGACE